MRPASSLLVSPLLVLLACTAAEDVVASAPDVTSDAGEGRGEGESPSTIDDPVQPTGDPAHPTPPDGGVAWGNLRGYGGGRDVALLWEGIKTATKYTVYRDGSPIGTALPRPPGTRFSSNATYVDRDVTRGKTYAYAVEAVLADGMTSPRSMVVSVTHDSKGTGIPEITLDAKIAPDLMAYLEKGKAFLETWYPKIGDALASPVYAPPAKFTMKIDAAPCGAGVTSGTTIGLCETFVRSNPDDLSIFAHEATHVMQAYASGAYAPTMIVEGIASWGGDVATGYVQPPPPAGRLYTEGYGTAEYFFDWIARTFDKPSFPRDVNLAGHGGTFDYRMFVTATGKSVGQLWTQMSGRTTSSPGRLKGPAGKCADLSFADTADGTPIGLVTCRTTGGLVFAQEIVALASAADPAVVSLHLANKCLAADAGRVVLTKCTDAIAAQSWKLANGALVNVGSGKCVQPAGGATTDGTPLALATCTGAASQKWSGPPI